MIDIEKNVKVWDSEKKVWKEVNILKKIEFDEKGKMVYWEKVL